MNLDRLIPNANRSQSLVDILNLGWRFGGVRKVGRGWSLMFWRGTIGSVEKCSLAWRQAWRLPIPDECEVESRVMAADRQEVFA